MKQIGDKVLRPGESWKLDDGTTVEFLGTKRYVTLSVRHDPGSGLLLVSCGFLLAGLMGSLFGRRRQVFFRVTTPGDADPAGETPTSGSSLVEAGGLPRTDYPGFADEFAQLVAAVGGGGRPDEAAGTGRDGHDRAGTREGTD